MSLRELEHMMHRFPRTERMPVLFLGHGSPMNAIEENEFTRGFRGIAQTFPKPAAILCISAHWLTAGTAVTAMEKPPTLHDFGGFPEALYQVQYPAPGNPGLARIAQELLTPEPVGEDLSWGLDHGAWSVIKHLYPAADVPVIQLSMDYTKPAAWHFELASRLTALRDRGVLLIGSGNIIHNLRLVDFKNMFRENYGYDWAIEAHALLNDLILGGDHRALLDYPNLGAAVKLAIPTPEHYLPLLYTLGCKTPADPIVAFNDQLLAGSLSMTSLKVG